MRAGSATRGLCPLRSAERCSERLDDTRLVVGFDLAEERQGKCARGNLFGYRAEPLFEPEALAHVRLQVNARDVLGGADPVSAEGFHHRSAVAPWPELDHVDEP